MAQRKLGVADDVIKSALVGAGWVSLDVEDTFKKINVAVSSPLAAVQATKPSGMVSASPAVVSKSTEPQTIRVSDLVSGVSPAKVVSKDLKAEPAKAKSFFDSTPVSLKNPKKSKFALVPTIAIVVAVIFAGIAVYLYMTNSALTQKAGVVSTESQSVTSQITSLQTQVQALTASTTVLASEANTLTAQNADLQTNLSFFTVLPGTAATSGPITVSGTVSGGKPAYVITTSYGVKVSIKNSADAGVHAALQPLLGTTTSVQVSGIYVPGLASVAVLTVNGNSVLPTSTVVTLTAMTTSTASTTAK